jgi:hypothetical protein
LPRSSGPILNNSLAVTLLFAMRNSSPAQSNVVQIEVFIITADGMPKTPIAQELFVLPPLSNMIRTYSTAGTLAYELQADTTSGGDFTANLFSTDVNGNMIDAQTVLGSETVKIDDFTAYSIRVMWVS